MLDDNEVASRLTKGRKIVAVLDDYRPDLANLDCLDVGCSAGVVSELLAERFRSVVGLDVRPEAVAIARARAARPNVRFEVTPEDRLAVADASFDAAICNQVYEHAHDPERVLSEIHRVLRPGGFCFFGARNRLGWTDGHYALPLLSLIPHRLGDLYVRAFTDQPNYDVHLRTVWGLRRLTSNFAAKTDYTLRIIADPERFRALDVVPTLGRVNRLLAALGPVAYFAIPNFIWLLEKPR